MILEEVSAFFERQSKTNAVPVSEITCGRFAPDGDFYAVGMENGRVVVFPVCVDGRLLPPGRLKVGVSFGNTDKKFDIVKCEVFDGGVHGVDFCHGGRLNPMLLTCNSAFCNLHRIVCDEVCEFENVVVNDQFVIPRAVGKTRSLGVAFVNEYYDPFLKYLIDVKCRDDSFIAAGYNGVDLFDFEKKVYNRFVSLDEAAPEISSVDVNGAFEEIFGVGKDDGTFTCFDMRQQPQNLSGAFEIDCASLVNERASAVNACRFSDSGDLLAIRTFGDVMLFDVRKTETPLFHFQVQWFPDLVEWIKESGMINDKFGLTFIDDTRIATGANSSQLVIIDTEDNAHSKHSMRAAGSQAQFGDRVRNVDIHPTENVLAVAEGERLHFQRICE